MRNLREFLIELGSNRRLTSVCLSNINIVEGQHLEDSDDVVEEICTFIRRNRKLLHMDLSKTGLFPQHLIAIAKQLNRAKGIQALHLAGNRITPEVIEAFKTHAKAEIVTETRLQPFDNLPSQAALARKLDDMRDRGISFTEVEKLYGEIESVPLTRKMQDVEL